MSAVAGPWAEVDAALARAQPATRNVIVRLHLRLVDEAVANVRPIRSSGVHEVLPPRRRMLDPALRRRLERSSVARRRAGVIVAANGLSASTLCSLHAVVAEPGDPDPGRFRRGTIAFQQGNDFTGAAVGDIPELVESAIADLAASTTPDAPALFTVGLLKVHPFNDANGRIARAVFDATARRGASHGLVASVDTWAADRAGYLEGLIAANPVSVGGGSRSDPAAFVSWTQRRAVAAGDVWVRRIGCVDELVRWLDRAGCSVLEAGVAATIAIDRNVAPDELDDLGVASAGECVVAANHLVTAGLLVWDSRGLLQPSAPLHDEVRRLARSNS